MITERKIAEKFTPLWKQCFPLLTSNFMRVLNASLVEKIEGLANIVVSEGVRNDVCSEVAFYLSEKSVSTEEDIDTIISSESSLNSLLTSNNLSFWHEELSNNPLTNVEREQITSLSKNINKIILSRNEVRFNPQFKGFGIVPNLTGDIAFVDELCEIKTVNRNFQSSDLKQLFIYLALSVLDQDQNNWRYGSLINPRRGTVYRFEIDKLIPSLTGGRHPREAFDIFLNSLSRDIEIDNKF